MTSPLNEQKHGLTEAQAREILSSGKRPGRSTALGYLMRVEQEKASRLSEVTKAFYDGQTIGVKFAAEALEAADRMARAIASEYEEDGPPAPQCLKDYRAARAKLDKGE